MRAQYHLRNSERGLLAWDVRKLIQLVKGLPVFELRLEDIRELDECFWFDAEGDRPTCRTGMMLLEPAKGRCNMST